MTFAQAHKTIELWLESFLFDLSVKQGYLMNTWHFPLWKMLNLCHIVNESAIGRVFSLGQPLKTRAHSSNRSDLFYGTEHTVILRKISQDNLQMLFQPTRLFINLVYTASYFQYTCKYRAMTDTLDD